MEVTNNFKMYLPSEYINSNYTYNLDSQYIQIRTNQNCYTQYSTTYCDCLILFPLNSSSLITKLFTFIITPP